MEKKHKRYSKFDEFIKADVKSGHFLANVLLITLILNASFKLLEFFEDFINPVVYKIADFITIFVAFVFAFINFFLSLKNNRESAVEYDFVTDRSIQEKVINAKVDPQYDASGFKWYKTTSCGETNYALSSMDVNKDLYLNPSKYLLKWNKKEVGLVNRQQKLLLKIFSDKQKKGIILFNDPHPALRTDMTLRGEGDKILNVVKSNYYSHITSNQLVFTKVYNADSTLFYDGWRMTLNEDFSLKSFEKSRAANMFGMSCLVISKDGHLIISRQGAKNDCGVNKLIPTATGSIDIGDINFANFKENNGEKLYFLEEMLKNAAKRETIEEIYSSPESLEDARVVGFMRMLFLGGHPEFMMTIFSSKTKDEIIEEFVKNNPEAKDSKLFQDRVGNEIDEINTSITLKDVFEKDIDKLIKEKLGNDQISLQLYMLMTVLHEHHKNKLL